MASADVALAEAAVEVARAELDKTVLYAPFDAVVADVAVERGEWVTPVGAAGQLARLDRRDRPLVALHQRTDGRGRRAPAPHGPARARVTIDSHPDQAFWGRVVRLAPYVLDVEQQNRTLEIEVELEDAELSATLLPGTSADVEVVLEVREDVLRIPTYALLEGRRVLVVEDGHLVEREVETGIRNWDWTEVVAGLGEGEEVVTSLDRPDVKAGAEAVAEPAELEP